MNVAQNSKYYNSTYRNYLQNCKYIKTNRSLLAVVEALKCQGLTEEKTDKTGARFKLCSLEIPQAALHRSLAFQNHKHKLL